MNRICGAKAKSTGNSCKLPPCSNGRCRFHGGMSTGPKTEAGRRRSREAVTKHGFYTKAAIEERRAMRELLCGYKENIASN